AFGAEVAMTSPDHPSGTDRIAEAVASRPEVTHIINIQGDEPLIDPLLVDSLATTLVSDPDCGMITAACPLGDGDQFDDPNVVKVVRDCAGHALYFSRSGIPFPRSRPAGLQPLRHLGIYGYRRDLLERFVAWPPGILEQAEQLEQLRALERGVKIHVIITNHQSIGLDTPEQVPKVEALLAAQSPP
ncbi:MAG: 3-deoxy-manno-octulosonate cytidylyltransferase, partial [Akkermansiaceae bacterium]|nr:3-deoxy-manno-octulosonate cytidylyltransferase [Akkermansiaceae bacterium]